MKTMKKVFATMLALAMLLTLAMPAFAANITISGGASGATYKAYKLLNATTSAGDPEKIAYTVNTKYETALKTVTGKTADAEIIQYIADLDTDGIRAFADAMYAQVKSLDADYTTTTASITGADQGYYLIAETELGTTESGVTDTYSLVMLNTAGASDVTVTTKEGTPTLEKKVQEKNDSTGVTSEWQDGADYDLGDAVPFKLTGTVSNQYASYKSYWYQFSDTLSAGLTLNEDSIKVSVVNGTDTPTVLTNDKYSVAVDGQTFTVTIEDLKTINEVSATSKIVVEYNATLNENAVIGADGNPNTAKLLYNNNPYSADKPETPGETPEDKVIVFTYKLSVDKVDSAGTALAGAGFTLYKLVETTVPHGYNKAEDIEFEVVATYDTNSDNPKLTALTVKNASNETISGEDKSFTATVNTGIVSTKVVNQSGTVLPSTGGIGTTIFYMVGGALALGAAILLITKKRMAHLEK